MRHGWTLYRADHSAGTPKQIDPLTVQLLSSWRTIIAPSLGLSLALLLLLIDALDSPIGAIIPGAKKWKEMVGGSGIQMCQEIQKNQKIKVYHIQNTNG